MKVAGISQIHERLEQVQAHCEMRVETINTADGKKSGTKTTIEIKLD